LQQDAWRSPGLVVWDSELQGIVAMRPVLALGVLSHLRAHDDWRQGGIVMGVPDSYSIFDKQPW
jgi:hypothetical protein